MTEVLLPVMDALSSSLPGSLQMWVPANPVRQLHGGDVHAA
jgi:hypothetical protein